VSPQCSKAFAAAAVAADAAAAAAAPTAGRPAGAIFADAPLLLLLLLP